MHKLRHVCPLVLASVAAGALAACGSSTTGPTATSGPATAVPTAAPTATAGPVSLTCPTAAALNSALGVSLGAPIQRPTTGNPPGDSGITCEYTNTTVRSVVILNIGTGPHPVDFFTSVEAGQRKAAESQGLVYTVTSVSGVGSRADYDVFTRAGAPTEDGILAESSNAGVVITVVPAVSQSQLGAFVSHLLG